MRTKDKIETEIVEPGETDSGDKIETVMKVHRQIRENTTEIEDMTPAGSDKEINVEMDVKMDVRCKFEKCQNVKIDIIGKFEKCQN